MCNKVVHLEPEEFIKILQKEQLSVYARVYVLDSGIAGLIYMCSDSHNLYYLDRFVPAPNKQEDFDKISFYDVHKDLYRKINLDNYLRDKNPIT